MRPMKSYARVRRASRPIAHRWCVTWQTPYMAAPAFEYFNTRREAREAARRRAT
jgi:hypothetical protein